MTNNTDKIIDNITAKTDKCILFLSLGKDSLVLLDLIYPKFDKIYCVFMYFVKDLEHIERWKRWVKIRYPRITLYQCPHFALSSVLRSGLFCSPNPNVKLLSLTHIIKGVKAKFGCEYVFLGMKKADSMTRRVMLMTYKDNLYENNGVVYPLAEWTNKEVIAYMKHKGMPQPVRYGKKASGGVGLNLDCHLWLRENFPQDLEKIYKAFPMSRKILFDYDYNRENKE